MVRAGVGALLIGAGLALMLSASRKLGPCPEVSPEETATEVAAASAEVAEGD
jgi:hypothetical protein